MNANTIMKTIGNVFTLGLYTFKVIGDINRHNGHKSHHQMCDCMGWCTACIFTEAFQKGKAKASA
jgi:hypothetical protein